MIVIAMKDNNKDYSQQTLIKSTNNIMSYELAYAINQKENWKRKNEELRKHEIDTIAIEQSVKRKSSHDTVYDIQELMNKLKIQAQEIDDMKKQMSNFEKNQDQDKDDMKKQMSNFEKNQVLKKKPGPDPKNLPVYQLVMRDIVQPNIKKDIKSGIIDPKDYKTKRCELIYEYWTGPKIGYYVSVLNANPQADNMWGILKKLLESLLISMTTKGLSIGFDKAELKNIIDNKDIETLQEHFPYEFDDEIKTEVNPIKEKDLLATFNIMKKNKHKLEQ